MGRVGNREGEERREREKREKEKEGRQSIDISLYTERDNLLKKEICYQELPVDSLSSDPAQNIL